MKIKSCKTRSKETRRNNTISTDDWRVAFFLLLLRAREIHQITEKLDEETVPRLLALLEIAHKRGLKHTGSELLMVLLGSDFIEPEDLAVTAFMLETDGLLTRDDFEQIFM